LVEIRGFLSVDDTSSWVREGLASKNMLSAQDAKLVEAEFERRLLELTVESSSIAPPLQKIEEAPAQPDSAAAEAGGPAMARGPSEPDGIDKSVLAFPEPRRHRNRAHLLFVAQQACLICGRQPSDAHHIRYAQVRALGRKASDEFTVPLCRIHHRAVHQVGDERGWWKRAGIDPLKVALALWATTTRGTVEQPVPLERRGVGGSEAPLTITPTPG